MRGQESCESAIRSSAGFCLSFVNTATVPTILYLEENYNCDCTKEPVAFGAISTEHSVMNSNYAVDGDEISLIKRLLTEIYPNNGFSRVSDSYDYWNLVDNLLPQCKQEIVNHNGYLAIRGDSGDPVEISTQTVYKLWDTFGGTVNSKGYKVLDSHLKVIYGDSITPQRAQSIYKELVKNGFACNNVILGVGSFSMQCLEQMVYRIVPEPTLQPYTRDTFGIAIKATYVEMGDKQIAIYKDPKTDDGKFKKSQKGCCVVTINDTGELEYTDGLSFDQTENNPANLMKPVFRDGAMVREQSLSEIRNKLHEGGF
jgi:nicotinamide phosphoribosyltransferase